MHLIFDFDGTLIDSFDKSIERFNILAERLNFKKISVCEAMDLKNLNSKELFRHLKIPLYKIPNLLYHARQQIKHEIALLPSFTDLPEILKRLHNAGFSLGIVTSNAAENVAVWLKINKINNLFDFVHAEASYFGKDRLLRKIIKKYEMNSQKVLYIGDETRDIEAAKKNGIYSVAVTWGFNSEKILLQYRPNYIARKPEDLLKIMDSRQEKCLFFKKEVIK